MPLHPLEPLTALEIHNAVSLLKASPTFNHTTRIVSIILREPDKSHVSAWPDADLPARQATAVLFDNAANQASTVTLDLTAGTILCTVAAPPNAQPTLSVDEQVECEQAVLASEEFKAALEKHYGIRDTSLVMVDIWSAGNYGSEEDRTHRLARPLCFLRSDPTDNGYVRPIEVLRPVIDLNRTDVVFLYTFGHTHIPRPEDCPVMPAAYIGFLLKPNGFFDQNPSNDIPPSTSLESAGACKHC